MVRKLAMTDLHWIAGFLEGEGSFTPHHGAIRISAAQVQREPLDRLQAIMGGKIYFKDNSERRRRGVVMSSDIFRYQLSGSEAAGWMMTLWSLMSPRRREQIEAALLCWKSKRPSGNVSRRIINKCVIGHEMTPENTRLVTTSKGVARHCITCWRSRTRARYRVLAHDKGATG